MGMFTVHPIFLAHLSQRISIGEVSKGPQSIQKLLASSLSLSNLGRFRFRSNEAGLGLREALQEILTHRLRWTRTNVSGFDLSSDKAEVLPVLTRQMSIRLPMASL